MDAEKWAKKLCNIGPFFQGWLQFCHKQTQHRTNNLVHDRNTEVGLFKSNFVQTLGYLGSFSTDPGLELLTGIEPWTEDMYMMIVSGKDFLSVIPHE